MKRVPARSTELRGSVATLALIAASCVYDWTVPSGQGGGGAGAIGGAGAAGGGEAGGGQGGTAGMGGEAGGGGDGGMGGGACAPDGGDDACTACVKEECCSALVSCQDDAQCPCWIACYAAGNCASAGCTGAAVPPTSTLIGCVTMRCSILVGGPCEAP
jgi:hypothetical protein